MTVSKQRDGEGILQVPYIEKSLKKSRFKMEVYIVRLLYKYSCFIGSSPRTIKTSTKRSHITSTRVKMTAFIRGLISSTIKPCVKKAR